VAIDRLVITISPGAGVTSVNLDNINVGSGVPEPLTFAMLGAGLCGVFAFRRLRGPSR
jgi:archaellin